MFKIYLRLLTFVRPIGKYAVPYFIYSILHALFNTVNYIMLIPIIQAMFDPEFRFEPLYVRPEFAFDEASLSAWLRYAYTSVFGEYNPMYVLILLATVTVLMNLLSNTFRYLGAWTVENMRTRTLQRMRNELFDNVINLNVGFFSEQRKGDIMSRITQDVMVVQFCITNTLQVAFREPFLIIGYLVAMFSISWELSVFSILFLPLVALIIGSIVKKLRHPAMQSQQRMGDMVSVLDESLSGVKLIKGYNATNYIRQKFYDINAEFSRLLLSMARRQQLASPMSEFLGISAVGVILVFGGMLVINRSLRLTHIYKALLEGAMICGTVLLIVGASTLFGKILTFEEAPQKLTSLVLGISKNPYVVLLMIIAVLYILGMFMETLSTIIILVPVLLPMILQLGIDPIHFGIILVVTNNVAMLTPPLGVNLFVSSRLAEVSVERVSLAVLPYLVALTLCILLFTFWPALILWLPHLLGYGL